MTFEEFLRKEYKKTRTPVHLSFYEWKELLCSTALVRLATRWNKEELAKMVPSKNDLLGVVAQGWCTKRNSEKCMDADLAVDIATALHKFLEERIK